MKLKRQIPKHIYARGSSGLAKPDFYVGPTIAEKQFPNGSQQAMTQDDDLKADMRKMKEEAAQEAGERPSLLSLLVGLVRGRAKYPRTAR